jgi:hypothetical protein
MCQRKSYLFQASFTRVSANVKAIYSKHRSRAYVPVRPNIAVHHDAAGAAPGLGAIHAGGAVPAPVPVPTAASGAGDGSPLGRSHVMSHDEQATACLCHPPRPHVSAIPDITGHYRTSPGIIKHQRTSRNITGNNETSPGIIDITGNSHSTR